MTIRLGDEAPDFVADTTEGTLSFHSAPPSSAPWRRSSPSSTGGVKVIGLSVDPVDSHERWVQDIQDVTGQWVNFPMIGDPDRRVAGRSHMIHDMIHPNARDTMTVRSVFVVGPTTR